MTISALMMAAIMVSEAPRPAAVTVQGEQPAQFIAAAADGKTLYVYDTDEAGGSCSGECVQAWPVLSANADDKPVGDWKAARNVSGDWQWLYKDRPVYTFAADPGPGVASGDGSGAVWHALAYEGIAPAVKVPTSATVKRRGQDFLLTDFHGQTLYTFAEDGLVADGKVGEKPPACVNACLEVWPALRAPALAGAIGDWKPVDRPDGLRQWAYRDKLVYTYSGDAAPDDVRGANTNGVWQTIPVSAASVSGASVTDVGTNNKNAAASGATPPTVTRP